MKVGENRRMPKRQCERSIKTYARGNNDTPSITKYGSPLRLDAQIVAMRTHCACTTRTLAKGAPKESKSIGHKPCVNTPPSHNQQGNIINSAAGAQCDAICVPTTIVRSSVYTCNK